MMVKVTPSDGQVVFRVALLEARTGVPVNCCSLEEPAADWEKRGGATIPRSLGAGVAAHTSCLYAQGDDDKGGWHGISDRTVHGIY